MASYSLYIQYSNTTSAFSDNDQILTFLYRLPLLFWPSQSGEKDSMRVLVTGGSGFLGSAILTAIREQEAYADWTLYNLDVRPPPEPIDSIQFYCADITSLSQVNEVFRKVNPDAVVHTAGWVPAGQKRYSTNKEVRDLVFSINYGGTKNVLEAARQTNCKAFVYTSSCTVISDDVAHDYPNMTEDIPTGNATLAYGASKAPAEAAVTAANGAKMATCSLRPATIIGPGDNFGVVATIHACISKGETPWIIGDSYNMYDFVYISNVADAHFLALRNLLGLPPSTPLANGDASLGTQESAAGQVFFISNQEPVYFRDFMLAIWAYFGHVPAFQVQIPATLAWVAGALAEMKTWIAGAEAATLSRGSVADALGTRYSNNGKARRVLGYEPRVRFADAVRLACEVCTPVLAEKRFDYYETLLIPHVYRITSAF